MALLLVGKGGDQASDKGKEQQQAQEGAQPPGAAVVVPVDSLGSVASAGTAASEESWVVEELVGACHSRISSNDSRVGESGVDEASVHEARVDKPLVHKSSCKSVVELRLSSNHIQRLLNKMICPFKLVLLKINFNHEHLVSSMRRVQVALGRLPSQALQPLPRVGSQVLCALPCNLGSVAGEVRKLLHTRGHSIDGTTCGIAARSSKDFGPFPQLLSSTLGIVVLGNGRSGHGSGLFSGAIGRRSRSILKRIFS